ncbi:MAG: protocatechuate 3,4-dioxygenase subunit alpha [Acidobacteriaceae bacterium]
MREMCSPSQTVGPFFRIGLEHLCARPNALTVSGGVTVRGRVLDANKEPVPDAMLELWRAGQKEDDASVNKEALLLPQGFIRVATDDKGAFRFCFVKPGRVDAGDGRMQAPHVVVLFFARGLLRHLITRMYFPGEPGNDSDPVLQSVPAERRATLIAKPEPDNPAVLTWDIRLQGEEETVFFAW